MLDIIKNTRTYRRFDARKPVEVSTLKDLINLGRLGGSARNCQPWQYLLITAPQQCASVFPYLGWAGYLSDWKGPVESERPTAYILCYLNKDRLTGSVQEAIFDLGIATQNILLGATAAGLGGCRIGAFSPKLADVFPQADHLELHHVIALGVPVEKVIIEECADNNIKYWRDSEQVHHVPKRPLEDLLLAVDEQ
ncbi:MAG: nitroreductase family protein [Desulfopila sp.]|jgi:nitroreductase|nr:nitroreductase family protein [Desulfopila sp.]